MGLLGLIWSKAEEDAIKLEDAAKDGDTRKVKADGSSGRIEIDLSVCSSQILPCSQGHRERHGTGRSKMTC